ncbi:Glycosyl transferase family 2 [Granulicella rosea]|uniref:Glycosyl transferase family 2 n=1 Tax=Granulicella rosea TaxID=474952 RepID=A0A239MNW2_9BACT|nr:glycosyltransferase family A protein [Granulicella rosea]SNT44170.1 Glycosyl transferase family 2 [Granulicella rosea]
MSTPSHPSTTPLAGASIAPIHGLCRASVIVPARNEEESLGETLDALRLQVELDGRPLACARYEVILLLNNCIDGSAALARRYAERYPAFHLHVLECELAADWAHVGTARRMLMDLACERLESLRLRDGEARAILSTDADTRVAEDWIAQNLREIAEGADVVGGRIHLSAADLDELAPGTRLYYERDCELQRLVAEVESLLDPDPADPWPRHLQHFGASLACTPAIYRASGGLPPVKPLEDVAFIDALRKVGARIRHSSRVNITTSSRLDGRAEVGLSGQLTLWTEEQARGLPQMVDSAEWMMHRFRSLANLRRVNVALSPRDLETFPAGWRDRIRHCQEQRMSTARFLERIDCNALIEETFEAYRAPRHAEITGVIQRLEAALVILHDAATHRS